MKKLAVLHIISDPKFIECCEQTFDIACFNNHYLPTIKGNETYLEEQSIDVLIVHYLKINEAIFLSSKKIDIPVIWFFWGADGFSLGKFYNRFLLQKTKKLKLTLAFKKNLKEGLKEISKRIFIKALDTQTYNQHLIKAIKNIDIIVPVVPGDFELLKKLYSFNAKSFHLNYITPVFFKPPAKVHGNNILLGNSSYYTNNHIEAIDELKKINLKERKVYIPLNYGDKNYGKYVKNYARNILGNNAVILDEFLPFEQYSMIVNSCEIVILNHLRQQAVGTVILALYSGATVYLQQRSTVFNYLQECGFFVKKIDKLNELHVLSQDQIEVNKQRCLEFFGRERQHEKLWQLYKYLTTEN